MREDYFDLKNLETAQREILSGFFPEYTLSRMSDWQKSSWLNIMRCSRFGKLTEKMASAFTLCKMAGTCTCLLASYKGYIRLYICDGQYVDHMMADVNNGALLEKMRQLLASYLLPASVDSTKEEEQRREMLLNCFKRCFCNPNFILA